MAECLALACGPVVDPARTLVELAILPTWAPNLHPLIVHFPIAWLIAAIVVDLVSLVVPRATWAETTAACLYPAGAISAFVTYLSGRQAAAGVLIPGIAQPIVRDHWNWALATTIYFAAVAALRLALTLNRRRLMNDDASSPAHLPVSGVPTLADKLEDRKAEQTTFAKRVADDGSARGDVACNISWMPLASNASLSRKCV